MKLKDDWLFANTNSFKWYNMPIDIDVMSFL